MFRYKREKKKSVPDYGIKDRQRAKHTRRYGVNKGVWKGGRWREEGMVGIQKYKLKQQMTVRALGSPFESRLYKEVQVKERGQHESGV